MNSDNSAKDELCELSKRVKDRLEKNRFPFLHILVQNIMDFHFVKVFAEKDKTSYQILENDITSYPAILYSMKGLITYGHGLPLVHRDKHYPKTVFDYIFEFNTSKMIDRIIDIYNDGQIDILKTDINTFFCKRKYDIFYEIFDVWDALEYIKPAFEILTQSQLLLEQMSIVVHKFDQHWIQYSPNDDIDEYFLERANQYVDSFDETSFFSDDTIFDGITFKEIKEVLTVIVMMCFRNINYAYVSKRKYPNLHLVDLLPLSVQIITLIKNINLAFDIDANKVDQFMRILLVDLAEDNNFTEPLKYPILLKVSDDFVLVTASSILTNPFPSLFQMLQSRCTKDWSKAILMREKIFRDKLYDIFNDTQFMKINQPIKISKNNMIITDIDALIFDKKHKVLALFQLKWNEEFSNSMRARKSKMKNYKNEGNTWVERVSGIIDNSNVEYLSKTFGIKKSDLQHCSKYLFVIGMYANEFTTDIEYDSRACWLSFSRIKLIKKFVDDNSVNDKLTAIVRYQNELRTEMKNTQLNFAEQKFVIDNYTIIFN